MNNVIKLEFSTSSDKIQCHHCDSVVEISGGVASYPNDSCPNCGKIWTNETKRHTAITVTMPQSADGGTM